MDNLNSQDAKNILEKIISETSCPVCLNTLSSPVRLCLNGHGLCGNCRAQLVQCPLCSEPFCSDTSRSVLLNKVVDLLPRKCRFDECQVFFTLGDDHEKWCGHHPTICKIYECKWTGCRKDIHNHVIKDHSDIQILSENSIKWRYPSIELSCETFSPLFAHGYFFWMKRYSPDDKIVFVDFIYVAHQRMKSSFKIKLTFINSKQSQSSSIDVTSANVMQKEETSMAFVYSKLKYLINNKGDLSFNLTVDKIGGFL